MLFKIRSFFVDQIAFEKLVCKTLTQYLNRNHQSNISLWPLCFQSQASDYGWRPRPSYKAPKKTAAGELDCYSVSSFSVESQMSRNEARAREQRLANESKVCAPNDVCYDVNIWPFLNAVLVLTVA